MHGGWGSPIPRRSGTERARRHPHRTGARRDRGACSCPATAGTPRRDREHRRPPRCARPCSRPGGVLGPGTESCEALATYRTQSRARPGVIDPAAAREIEPLAVGERQRQQGHREHPSRHRGLDTEAVHVGGGDTARLLCARTSRRARARARRPTTPDRVRTRRPCRRAGRAARARGRRARCRRRARRPRSSMSADPATPARRTGSSPRSGTLAPSTPTSFGALDPLRTRGAPGRGRARRRLGARSTTTDPPRAM